jgi:hypothetical protein
MDRMPITELLRYALAGGVGILGAVLIDPNAVARIPVKEFNGLL